MIYVAYEKHTVSKQYMQPFVTQHSHTVHNTHKTQAKITSGYISEYL